MSLYSIEQDYRDREAYQAYLRTKAVDDLGFLSVNIIALGLVGPQEREPFQKPGIGRANPGSVEHGLGITGTQLMARVEPPLYASVQSDWPVLGYGDQHAA